MSLKATAARIRRGTLAAIYAAGSGHPGGSLSAADLLAFLSQVELLEDRAPGEHHRFVLSKGHACPALYATAAELGLISHASLRSLRKLGSPLQGHPHVLDTPWVETSTGSLGQGFSVAVGMALGFRHRGESARVYALLGDGELQEGEVWEAAMFSAHHKLGRLCAIVDYNKLQSDNSNANIMGLEPLAEKWAAFGWHVREIDGHDFDAMADAFDQARNTPERPSVVIAHTVKGKGVSFMEGEPPWHGSVKIREEEMRRALEDLQTPESEMEQWIDGCSA